MSRPHNNLNLTPTLPYSYESPISSILTYLNPNSTQFQLNLDSTPCQPHPQINLSLNINLNPIMAVTQKQPNLVV